MAADEKLRALKKAYADIILNTAKEAASRVMASERKAQRFQRELQMSKDEALRMLLRLKQTMDSKISGAELTSVSQQKKIDELEAQLQEAEDIVKDLREELREVNSELERLRSSKEKLRDDQYAVAQRGISEENEAHSSQSIALPPNQSESGYVAANDLRDMQEPKKNEGFKFYSGIPYVDFLYPGCPDLPSIILRSKECELYRNGCTQRIRASEGNLLNRMLSGKTRQMKDEVSTQEDVCGKQIVSVPNCSSGNLSNDENEVEADDQLDRWHPVPIFCVRKKRVTRYRKRIINSSRSFPDQLPRTNQTPDVSCAAHLISVRSDVHFEDNGPKVAPKFSSDEAELGLGEDCAETSDNDAEHGNQSTINDIEGTEKSLLVMKDSALSSVVSVGETDLRNSNIAFPISKPVGSPLVDGFVNQPTHERIIKYTFQRKRKKASLSDSNGVVSLVLGASKRQTLCKQSDPVEQEKSNLVIESSQHFGQSAHGTHQVVRE